MARGAQPGGLMPGAPAGAQGGQSLYSAQAPGTFAMPGMFGGIAGLVAQHMQPQGPQPGPINPAGAEAIKEGVSGGAISQGAQQQQSQQKPNWNAFKFPGGF